ncbi:NAD-dependent epimerase/dehydratase [Deferribacter desulfuricans SSM1]|uniref:NAD-dependent epimerase/dehydratase n=1 Tax=Deferribacter desulfuricans (strain DSM 14783 / JCM 11476 / NBRC 101012 / SSM1) TaxID=639282 RepID=D3PCJ0_DEFDS|nr:SDR family NAD(P)-dependent oxidoreductase [Deferribacter desulfuricans]BAI80313.1 NAD-dependent epimerase/dehydratase [Deferribacter desulfuricans SSM1]
MNILLTGAAGFIGYFTAKKLLNDGHKVIGVDNLNDYYDVRLKEYRKNELLKNENFQFYKLDISNYDSLSVLFQNHKFDAIINLAARAGVRYSIENPFVYFETNSTGTLNLLELAKDYGVNKFVLASTSSLYAGQEMPFTEDKPVNTPISPYAASKKSAEVTAYTYHYFYGIDVSVVRYFTVYGPAGRPDMSVFRFISQIYKDEPIIVYGDGSQSRDFTYVEDIADGTVKALKEIGYEIINLGNNNPNKLIDMIKYVEELLGKKAKIINKDFHKADMMATWADITKAKELLGWEPKVDLKTGLENTVNWFLDNKDFAFDIKLRD